jgi:hypothetical protein
MRNKPEHKPLYWEDLPQHLRRFLEEEAKRRKEPFETLLQKKTFFANVIGKTAEEIQKLGLEKFRKKYGRYDVETILRKIWRFIANEEKT